MFSLPANAVIYRSHTYSPGIIYVNPYYKNNYLFNNTSIDNWDPYNNFDMENEATERHSTDIFDSNWQ
jgi:hypothetical protein